MRYAKERPEVDFLADSYEDRLHKSLLTKADFWQYEEEHRMFEENGPPGSYQFPPRLLNGVILGARMSQQQTDQLLALVHQRNVETEIMQAERDPELFRVAIRSKVAPVPAA